MFCFEENKGNNKSNVNDRLEVHNILSELLYGFKTTHNLILRFFK